MSHTKEPECVIHVCICGACTKRFDIPQGINLAAFREVVEALRELLCWIDRTNQPAVLNAALRFADQALAHAQGTG